MLKGTPGFKGFLFSTESKPGWTRVNYIEKWKYGDAEWDRTIWIPPELDPREVIADMGKGYLSQFFSFTLKEDTHVRQD